MTPGTITQAVGDQVTVTKVDGRTFSGRLHRLTSESIVIDRRMRSKSVRHKPPSFLVRIALAAVESVEDWRPYAGFCE